MRFDAGPPPSFSRASDGQNARFAKVHTTDRDPWRGEAIAHVRVWCSSRFALRPLAEVAWLESKRSRDLTASGSGECFETWGPASRMQ